MRERLSHICAALHSARVFADIGCDHGYCTQYMLRHGLCERAYVSDISAGSLKKAESLLAEYIAEGRCIPVVADGLQGIPEPCDLVLIAGMGGEEIVRILGPYPLPEKFVLQPMKNAEKVRRFLLARGGKIECDFTFSEGDRKMKFYDLICGCGAGGDSYTDMEFRYGRDNLRGGSSAFCAMLRTERDKLAERAARPDMNEKARAGLLEKFREIEGILHEIETDL